MTDEEKMLAKAEWQELKDKKFLIILGIANPLLQVWFWFALGNIVIRGPIWMHLPYIITVFCGLMFGGYFARSLADDVRIASKRYDESCG